MAAEHQFAYARCADQDAQVPARHPAVIVGAGPVGLVLAIDLAQRGQRVVLLDDADRIGEGSRAICFAKRTLEIFDRLGIGETIVSRGIVWQTGRVFRGERELYSFDLLPEGDHKMPAFVNIPQNEVEAALVARAASLPLIDMRWRNRVTELRHGQDHTELTVETPEGPYRIEAGYVIACDGARSPTRSMLGLDFVGEVFPDRFLIADVRMHADYPTERRFWFDPPFHAGQSALLHRQPDDIWRIDLQLGREADPAVEKRAENVRPRIARMLGHDDFDLVWVSIYTFQCRRLARFVHGRVVFAGDAAHQVSPFGARGANSGIQDADNLGWKLDFVLSGRAPPALLDTYDIERGQAADENIGHSTRSTDFIAPHGPVERRLRDAILDLAPLAPFARRMVNSGRLSLPSAYDTDLSTPGSWPDGPVPGSPLVDGPLTYRSAGPCWLSDLVGPRFLLLANREAAPALPGLETPDVQLVPLVGGVLADRYGLAGNKACMIRPDGHVAACLDNPVPETVHAAWLRASGQTLPSIPKVA